MGGAVRCSLAWILLAVFASAFLPASVHGDDVVPYGAWGWWKVLPPQSPSDPYGWDIPKGRDWLPPSYPDPKEFLKDTHRLVVNPPAKIACFDDYLYAPSYWVGKCPPKCPNMCYAYCYMPRVVCPCVLSGSVCDDPRFVGGDGNIFLFHGRKDADFCLLSDANLHINAHFIGKRNTNASRDFTWVQALGIRFDNHRLYLGVKKTATWDNNVDRLEMSFDGEPIYLEDEKYATWRSFSAPALSITRTRDTNLVTVQLDGKFKIIAHAAPVTEKDSKIHNYGVTSNDSLAHLNVAFKFYSLNVGVHGVLGQTYRPDYVSVGVDNGAKIPVMGGADKYSSSDIFTTDCAVARFTGEEDSKGSIDMITEPKDVRCGSGKVGAGLVCKK